VPNWCIRISGNYQPTQLSEPNQPNRLIRLSGNLPLEIDLMLEKLVTKGNAFEFINVQATDLEHAFPVLPSYMHPKQSSL